MRYKTLFTIVLFALLVTLVVGGPTIIHDGYDIVSVAVLHPFWDDFENYHEPVSDYHESSFIFTADDNQFIEIIAGLCGVYEPGDNSYWGITFSNISTAETIWSYYGGWGWDGIYSLTLGHSYEMFLYAGTTVSQGDMYNGAQAEVYFWIYGEPASASVVPAPGAILLAGIGTMIVGQMRRRRVL